MIIDLFLEKDTEGIFNIGDEQISYLEMASTIIEKNGNDLSYVMLREQGSKSKLYLDTTLLKCFLAAKGE